MFERLLDALDAALEMSILPDRNQRLHEIAAHCAEASRLSSESINGTQDTSQTQ